MPLPEAAAPWASRSAPRSPGCTRARRDAPVGGVGGRPRHHGRGPGTVRMNQTDRLELQLRAISPTLPGARHPIPTTSSGGPPAHGSGPAWTFPGRWLPMDLTTRAGPAPPPADGGDGRGALIVRDPRREPRGLIGAQGRRPDAVRHRVGTASIVVLDGGDIYTARHRSSGIATAGGRRRPGAGPRSTGSRVTARPSSSSGGHRREGHEPDLHRRR